MKPEMMVILGLFFAFVLAEILKTSFFKKKGEVPDDAKIEIISTTVLVVLTQPAILFVSYWLASTFAPGAENMLIGIPVIAQIALFVVFDDMTQYWWHRASHTFPWLYNLHRCHHNSEYLSIRVIYRNNLFYYAMMPGIWFSGVLIYMGLGWIYRILHCGEDGCCLWCPFRCPLGRAALQNQVAFAHHMGGRTHDLHASDPFRAPRQAQG